jgi:hypothetical protein
MMSDDEVDEVDEGPVDDPKVSQGRHRCIVIGILVVAALAIAAIVLPLVLDNCDCPSETFLRSVAPAAPDATGAPVLPPTTTNPSPTSSPITQAPAVAVTPPPTPPAPSAAPSTQGLKQFIDVFLIPRFGSAPFEDTNSPQYRAAEFLVDVDTIASDSASIETLGDRYALTVLYYSTVPEGWLTCNQDDANCANPWLNPEQTHCDWEFIRCDETSGRVVDLIFRK